MKIVGCSLHARQQTVPMLDTMSVQNYKTNNPKSLDTTDGVRDVEKQRSGSMAQHSC